MNGHGKFVLDFLSQVLVHSMQGLEKRDHVVSADVVRASHRIKLGNVRVSCTNVPQMVQLVDRPEEGKLRLADDAYWVVGERARNHV
jgi:hypothetical protein